jgi:hypothetical protein
MRLIFRHFALANHANANPAAYPAEATGLCSSLAGDNCNQSHEMVDEFTPAWTSTTTLQHLRNIPM